MADFELAVAKTIANEGGDKYTDREHDRGGPTKYGISFKFIKTYMRGNFTDEQCINKVKNLTLLDAKRLYKECFWDANRYGEIEDQAIAEKVFDMAVLFGSPRANFVIQIISRKNLSVDGIIGDKTLDWINNILMIKDFKYELFELAVKICNKDSMQDENLKGWLNRIMS